MLEDAMGSKELAVEQLKDALGVLLVYGVGRQARGETLIAATNPIYQFLDRLPDTKDKVDIIDCFLRPRFAPAHLRLQFRWNVEGRSLTESWLVAEAHWADSFRAASFGELLQWSFAVLPWALLSHFGAGVLTSWQTRKRYGVWWEKLSWGVRLLQALALMCAAPVFYLAVQTMLLLTFVIALVPSPGLRSVAYQLQQWVGSVVGDIYLLSHPVQGAAMTSIIRRNLRWLAQRCKKVVVIAHSQGAALSYMVLRDMVLGDRRPQNLAGFLTYGSSIKKLGGLEAATEGEQVNLRNAWLAVGSMAMALLALLSLFVHPPSVLVSSMAWVALFLILATGIATGTAVGKHATKPGLEQLTFPSIALAGLVAALGVTWALVSPGVTSIGFGVAALMAGLTLYFVGGSALQDVPGRLKWRRTVLLCVAAATPAVLVVALSRLNVSVRSWQLFVTAAVAAPMFLLLVLVVARSKEIPGLRLTLEVMRSLGIKWKDCYASRDPVAQGGMPALSEYSTEIHNRDSFWSDHTSYWENADEFVPQVTEFLFTCAGWDGRVRWPEKGKVTERREWRVSQFATARSTILAVWLLVIVLGWTQFASVAAKLMVFAPLAKRLAPPGLATKVEGWAALLGSDAGRIGASCIIVSTAALAVYLIVAAIWHAQDRNETKFIQQRNGFVPDTRVGPRLSAVLMALVFIAAGSLQPWLGPKLVTAIAMISLVIFARAYSHRVPDKPANDEEEAAIQRKRKAQAA